MGTRETHLETGGSQEKGEPLNPIPGDLLGQNEAQAQEKGWGNWARYVRWAV